MSTTTPAPAAPALLTISDLAAQLALSVGSIEQKRHRGESLPPALKLGGRTLRWRQADVDRWLDAQLERDPEDSTPHVAA